MQIRLLFLLIISVPSSAIAQVQENMPEADSMRFQKFLTMVNSNREQSYVTVGSGIGNLEPLILEAKFSPSYFFTRNKRLWAVMINPQVQIRMLNQKSLPIRNPSYRVYGTFYQELKFWKESFLGRIFYENALWHGSFAHHSNGQAGDFFLQMTAPAKLTLRAATSPPTILNSDFRRIASGKSARIIFQYASSRPTLNIIRWHGIAMT